MGIFYRLFKLLEEECHELDLVAVLPPTEAGPTYERYTTLLRKQSTLQEEEEKVAVQVEGMEQLVTVLGIALPNASSYLPYQQLCREVLVHKEKDGKDSSLQKYTS